MKFKKITSLTALISFLLLLLNSFVLYIVPHGRIAYWGDWRFWGLTKTEWANQHIIVGILFLLAIFLHSYYNWNLIVTYLKDKTRQLKIFTREFNIALILTIVFTLGAYVEVPPFNWILNFSESIKDSAAKKYGEPPYGRAEISTLKAFTSKMSLDLGESMGALQKAGFRVENDRQTLLEIAKTNRTSPQTLYLSMKPAKKDTSAPGLPDAPKTGLGRLTLSEFCQTYQISISTVMKALEDKKIKASPDNKIKEIAEQNSIEPAALYDIIKESLESKE